jgi:hypothetical protein
MTINGVETSGTNRACCKMCGDMIVKGEARLSEGNSQYAHTGWFCSVCSRKKIDEEIAYLKTLKKQISKKTIIPKKKLIAEKTARKLD